MEPGKSCVLSVLNGCRLPVSGKEIGSYGVPVNGVQGEHPMRSALVVGVTVFSFAIGSWPALAAAGQQTVSVSGTARKEAKRPYTNYTVRARQVDTGQIAASTPLDGSGDFIFTGMTPASYLMELVDGQNKVVCTAGPFPATNALAGISIDCHRREPPAALLLLGAAAAAGITAAVVASPPASPSR